MTKMLTCQELSYLAASASLQLGVSVLRRLTKIMNELTIVESSRRNDSEMNVWPLPMKVLLGRFDNE